MILADLAILHAIEQAGLVIRPFDPARLQPVSYDLTTSRSFRRPQYPDLPILADVWRLAPGDCVLASTVEWVEIPPTLTGFVIGRSGWARRFLRIEEAGLVDPGFRGELTLEVKNEGPLMLDLVAGQSISQLFLLRNVGRVIRPYGSEGLGSHYQGQRGATPAVGL